MSSRRARHASTLLAAVILALLFSACGSGEPSSGATQCQLPPLQVHIAVDRSGSLNSVWQNPRAIDNLAIAIGAIPDSASVRLDVFTDSVREYGPWKVGRSHLLLRDSVVRAMRSGVSGSYTDIYAVADVLARRIDSASASTSRHIVFFISDEKHLPPPGRPVDSAAVTRAWGALRQRLGPDRLRVISIRVGSNPDSVFSRIAGVTSADLSGIPSVGAKVRERLENDPLVAQLRRERDTALVEATLDPPTQKLGYAGGDVAIRVRSNAQCGGYRLDDGTEIGPGGDAVVQRHVESGLSFVDGLLLRRAAGGEAANLIPATAYPRVTRYVSRGGGSTRDTVFPKGGVPLRPEGRVAFARLWWPHALGLAALALLAWMLLPPRGGTLSATAALAFGTDVDLGPARRGREVLTPEAPLGPWIAVRLVRRSHLLLPTRTRLVVRVLRPGRVAVAREDHVDGSFTVAPYQADDVIFLDGPAFLLWPNRKGDAPSRNLNEYVADAFPGYHWKPRP